MSFNIHYYCLILPNVKKAENGLYVLILLTPGAN